MTMALPPPPPAPPPSPPPPPSASCRHYDAYGGDACCGGQGVAPIKLATPSAEACATACANHDGCGVSVVTVGQSGHAGETTCWLTNLTAPHMWRNNTNPDQGWATIVLSQDPATSGKPLCPHPTWHGPAPPPHKALHADAIIFGEGGWQSGQGGSFGSEFFVENVLELLDVPGEWFHDSETQTLYLHRNVSRDGLDDVADADTSEYIGAELESLIRIEGSQAEPVTDIDITGLVLKHTAADFMAPYEVPGGGDQSVHRGAAFYVEGAERVRISRCSFESLDGSAVIFSRYNRDSSVTDSDFSLLGSAAVIVLGEAKLIDGTAGNYPNRTLISGNVIRDGGVFSKNYLGGAIFQALGARSIIRGNIIYNTPRSCLTFNDNFGGGDLLESNIMFNCNRESSDTGNVYTYNRLPFLTNERDGSPSLTAADRIERYGLFIQNYGSCWALDHDDGSSWYQDYSNVQVYAGAKQSTFGTGGHSKRTFGNLFVYPDLSDLCGGTCASGAGYENTFTNNTCITQSAHPYTYQDCDPGRNWSRELPSPLAAGNRFLTSKGNASFSCGRAAWTLAEAQAHGYDVGSRVDRTPSLAEIVAMAEDILAKGVAVVAAAGGGGGGGGS